MGNIHITQAKLSAGWTAAHLDKLCSDMGHGPCFSQYLLHWLFAFMVEHIGGGSNEKGNRCTFCSCFHRSWIQSWKEFWYHSVHPQLNALTPSVSLPIFIQFTVNTSSATKFTAFFLLLGAFLLACLFLQNECKIFAIPNRAHPSLSFASSSPHVADLFC